jgi:hypothetical protein
LVRILLCDGRLKLSCPTWNSAAPRTIQRGVYSRGVKKTQPERRLKLDEAETLGVLARYMMSLHGGIAVGKKFKSREDFSSAGYAQAAVRYAQAANRVAEVEALLARQKGKIAGLRRLGLYQEANAARPLLARLEILLCLCIEDRDRLIYEPTAGSMH